VPKLYIISGCNGAGKTTASYTILPDTLDCKEFINADEIARGLSPFQPENTSIKAGKLMLERIKYLIKTKEDFAFETTLSTRSYVNYIREAKTAGYSIMLLFFWLHSEELAIRRVKTRVAEGGHNIPEDVIRRRYGKGLQNFFNLYKPIVDNWMLIDNSGESFAEISIGDMEGEEINNEIVWQQLKQQYHE
jgi:predicted ABC-type ATPase